ncbi:Scr1 family TA system antitoxin-like transcriptional regulator [Kitasatospora sp. HPMI-4]|uniref:Scr1 family TA system antitoxin-like transcriptional regulator n=1 Tax=Kitasatospora sp. HPMI-4 TaxID=3448443 RepID=UPI003F1C7EA5
MPANDIDPTSSPLAALGVQLRRFRQARGLKQSELAAMVYVSTAYISYVERAERTPSRTFVEKTDEALETGGTLTLMWWNLRHGESLIDGFPEFASQEGKALRVRLFELAVVPGLLQTREYATALVYGGVSRGTVTEAQAAERLKFRLHRQKLLDRTPSPTIHAILDESCLRRTVGGPAVMAAQLAHLEQLARRPRTIIQVAPFGLGERIPFTMPLILLGLPDHTQVGYTETLQRGYLERDPAQVTEWVDDYDRLQVAALSQAASVDLIRAARKDILNMIVPTQASWFKSSYSNGGGACIEVSASLLPAGVVPVRDSKDPKGPQLHFSPEAWSNFTTAVTGGEFGEV